VFDLDRRYVLHPQVAVRPEPFGALLYHFGTRRLSFLKDPRLLAAVRGLDSAPSARAACTAAGVGPAELPAFAKALGTLADTDMLSEAAT
jgi:mycofactocin biosynthesis protein MftB